MWIRESSPAVQAAALKISARQRTSSGTSTSVRMNLRSAFHPASMPIYMELIKTAAPRLWKPAQSAKPPSAALLRTGDTRPITASASATQLGTSQQRKRQQAPEQPDRIRCAHGCPLHCGNCSQQGVPQPATEFDATLGKIQNTILTPKYMQTRVFDSKGVADPERWKSTSAPTSKTGRQYCEDSRKPGTPRSIRGSTTQVTTTDELIPPEKHHPTTAPNPGPCGIHALPQRPRLRRPGKDIQNHRPP